MIDDSILAQWRAIVGEANVFATPTECAVYAADAALQDVVPEAVVRPATTEEVARVLAVANAARIPVTPRGAGTSLSGGAVAIAGGMVLSLERMDGIREIDLLTSTITVGAGVVTGNINRAVAEHGLFYPPDPASLAWCTIGGNIATNAGGPRCLKYGVTRPYVLGMTVALMDGRILHLGGKLLKQATGYPLLQLFIGSEGTLGVVTEVTLRLVPLPHAWATALISFATVEAAADAVTHILTHGVLPATIEFMDDTTLRYAQDQEFIPPGTAALLVVEQDGTDAPSVNAQMDRIAQLCREVGATGVHVAPDEATRQRYWAMRRAASLNLAQNFPHKLGEDIVVPRSAIPAVVREIRAIAEQHGLTIAVFGHIGDGNLHPNILFERVQSTADALGDDAMLPRAAAAAEAIFRAALAQGGLLSGEHGVGVMKAPLLTEALGETSVELMRSIKSVFDPQGLLNRGKVFPDPQRPDVPSLLTTLHLRDALIGG